MNAKLHETDLGIGQIAEGFLNRTLPKIEWTHAAHWAATFWLLRHRSDLDLARDMPGLIRAYNLSVGGRNTDTEGYHETITQASLRAARNHLDAYPADASLAAVLSDLLKSPLGRPDWILRYWSRERLFSVNARREWVEPDLHPLT